MNKEQMSSLVSEIITRVYGDTGNVTVGSERGCGPVKLQIGFYNNIAMHDGIVVTDAPAVVTDVITEWVAKQKAEDQLCLVRVSAGFGGILIR